MDEQLRLRLSITAKGMEVLEEAKRRLKDLDEASNHAITRINQLAGQHRQSFAQVKTTIGNIGPALLGLGGPIGIVVGALGQLGGAALSGLGGILNKAAEVASFLGNVLMSTLQRVAQAFAGLTLAAGAALGALGYSGVKYNATLEQLRTAFEVLLGSPERAEEMVKYLERFADTTNYTLPQVAEASKRLSAFGLDVTTWLQRSGNLASGMNQDLTEVADALGRLSSGQTGEAFERLRGLGIARPALEAKGLTFDNQGQLTSSVAEAMDAVGAIIDAKFGGMMERQSRTFLGLWSTLTDKIRGFAGQVSQGLFQSLESAMSWVIRYIDILKDSGTWKTIVDGMSLPFNLLGGLLNWLVQQIPMVTQLLVDGFQSGAIQRALMTMANGALTAFRWIGGAIAGVIAVLQKGLGQDLVEAAHAAWDGLKELGLRTVEMMDRMVQAIGQLALKFLAFDAAMAAAAGHEVSVNADLKLIQSVSAGMAESNRFLMNLRGAMTGEKGWSTQTLGVDLGKYGALFQQAFQSFGASVPSAAQLLGMAQPAGAAPPVTPASPWSGWDAARAAPQQINYISMDGMTFEVNTREELMDILQARIFDQLYQAGYGTTGGT